MDKLTKVRLKRPVIQLLIIFAFLLNSCGYTINDYVWWDIEWTNRRQLKFDNSAQSENLKNFPVLVKLDSTRIDYSKTQENGGEDLRFVDPDGTLLNHEVERWNTGGVSIIWVKVPRINGSSNSDYIWMYYGNDAAVDVQDAESVWSNNYRLVMHFNEISGDYSDSTSYKNNGVAGIGITQGVNGNIGNGVQFEKTLDSYINAGNDTSLDIFNNYTITVWIKPKPGCFGYILSKDHIDIYAILVWTALSTFTFIGGDGFNDPGLSPLPTDEFTFIASSYSQSRNVLYQYRDDFPKLTSYPYLNPIDTSGLDLLLGKRTDISGNSTSGNYYYDGFADEIRISNTARSDPWIAAQYISMSDNFISYGSEE